MFCNHCGAKNPDQAVSCLTCGKPQTQSNWSSLINNTPRSSDRKHAMFLSVIQYLVELAIVLLVLFHNYGGKDATVIVSLLVVAYNMIRAHLGVEGVLSAKFFLDLSNLIQRNAPSDEQEDGGHEDITVLVRRDLPYAWAGVVFHMALAALAAIKLLLALLL
jgi:hypothetical protein